MNLRKTWAIALREFGNYFVSPIVYGFLTVFLFLTGFFTVSTITGGQAELNVILILFIFLFMVPLLTMRLVAEERARGTIEFVFTSPVRSSEFILGKFLAVLAVFGVAILFTFEFPVFLMYIADPDIVLMATQYLGLVLIGGSFLAIGLFCSCLTENQIIAAVSSFMVLLFLWVISLLKGMVPSWYSPAIDAFNLTTRMQHFQQGVLQANDIVFFLSITIGFLYASMLYMNARSWQQ